MWKTIQILSIIFASLIAKSQDLHFTNNKFAPIQFNPANIGHFEGNLRLGSVYRSQFSDFIQNPYETILFYSDAPLNYKFRKHDWSGLGLQIYSDKAGDLSLQNTGVLIGGSYHISNDAKYSSVFSFGATFGINYKNIDISRAVFPDFATAGSSGSNDYNKLATFNATTKDFNAGIIYTQKVNKTSIFQVGIAMLYIMNKSFTAIQNNQIGRRWNAHILYKLPFRNNRTTMEWSSWYSNIDQFQNLSFQSLLSQKLSKKRTEDFILNLGLGYRIGDAMQLLTGARYSNWYLSIAYDITISDAHFYNNYKGALELAIYKVFVFNRKPEVKPIIFCPKL